MGYRLVLSFAAWLLIIGVPAEAGPSEDRGSMLRALAGQIGRALGAASACPGIERTRIAGIAGRITEVIQSSAANEDESNGILELFHKAQSEGTRSIPANQTGCAAAERRIAELENAASPPAPHTATPTALPVPAAPSTQASAAAVRGVTDKEIRFGATLPLSGPNKDYGRQMWVGVEAAFRAANDAGGVNGRMLRLVVADDGYEPGRTGDAVKQLYEKDEVFGFISNAGAPTAMVSLPFALERHMLFFAGFTGADILRQDPPDRYVFNYRPSYSEEIDALVHYLVKLRRFKPEQIAVFAQQDPEGDGGFAAVAKALRAVRGGGEGFILRIGYPRNTIDVDAAVAQLKAHKTSIKAVILIAAHRAAARFIEKTHDANPGLVYANFSNVNGIVLRDELMLLGSKYTSGVIVTQVVPAVEGYSSIVLEYRAAIAKHFSGESPSYVALECYISARVLIEALKRAGPQPDTEKVVEALENMRDLDLGLGTTINFGKSDHQGSHKIWGTELSESGKYMPIELQ
ncbi:MAG: ABC transporter substrate-binding protein [Rhodomicrobium sp.]